ncbi:MAG: murein biosynthesis integral membrane protein MurJ, partial [Acidimicrobiales bacterium]
MTPGPAGPAPATLGRRAAVMAAGTLLSRLTGFGRVFALAYALGATRLTDTYTLANTTPNILYELVLGGVLSGTALAVFVRQLGTREPHEAWRAISAVFTVALVALAALTVAFLALAPLLIRLYSLRNQGSVAADQLAVATLLLVCFAPQVFCYGLISLTTALLNARRRFAAPMFAPVLNNLVVIGVLLAFPHVAGTTDLAGLRGDRAGLVFLGLGTTAGVAAMAAAQFPLRTLRAHVHWRWEPGHEAVRTILRLSGWTVGWVVANQLALFVVFFLANGEAGDVAAYTMAQILYVLPHGVVSVSIMTALAPELAERWSLGDRPGFQHQVGLGLRTIAAVTLPAAAAYVVLAKPIVAAVLEHGALGEGPSEAIAGTLALMALGLPAFSTWLFLSRAYQAMQDTRSLFLWYLVENGVNILAALALYPVLGVEGLGLAHALAYTAGTLVLV